MENKLIFQKNAEKTTNKLRLPKFFVEKNGLSFYMEIYEEKIVLIPVKKNKEAK